LLPGLVRHGLVVLVFVRRRHRLVIGILILRRRHRSKVFSLLGLTWSSHSRRFHRHTGNAWQFKVRHFLEVLVFRVRGRTNRRR
jgi:hypothetical protein